MSRSASLCSDSGSRFGPRCVPPANESGFLCLRSLDFLRRIRVLHSWTRCCIAFSVLVHFVSFLWTFSGAPTRRLFILTIAPILIAVPLFALLLILNCRQITHPARATDWIYVQLSRVEAMILIPASLLSRAANAATFRSEAEIGRSADACDAAVWALSDFPS
jgi:hypothetical protein